MVNQIKTATGEIQFATCRFYYDDAQSALERLSDLHFRSLGEPGPFKTSVANSFSPDDAFRAYSDTTVALLAQLAIASPTGRTAMLGEIAAAADRIGSLSGLEGLYLSAARAAQYEGAFAGLGSAAEVFQSLGLPSVLGGGASTSTIFDVGTGFLGFVTGEQISQAMTVGTAGWMATPSLITSQMGIGGTGAGLLGLDLLFSGSLGTGNGLGPGGSGSTGIGVVGPSPELTGDRAEEYAKVGGAMGTLVGGAIGWSRGGPAGAGVGIGLGGALGGAAGYLVGWAVEKLDTPYVAPAPDAHQGPYGPYGPFIQPYIGASLGSHTATGEAIPAPSGTGSSGTSSSGSAPAPATPVGTPPAAGSGAADDKKTIKPGESTKSPVDDGSGGTSLNNSSGLGWFPARAPYGEGMGAFAVWQQQTMLLIGLPRLDDDGSTISDGYFPVESIANSVTPAHQLRRLISPTADGRGRIKGGTMSPNLMGTGPSMKLTIPARVDGISSYGALESVRALLETIQKFG